MTKPIVYSTSMSKKVRKSGVLLHPTSLPSKYGIGSLGKEALQCIDLLDKTGIRLWQILPLGPTGYGDSPYATRSSFAGNELLIDLEELMIDGYLEYEDIRIVPVFDRDRIDYQVVRAYKEPLLAKAAQSFFNHADKLECSEYKRFCKEHASWLDDYALYSVLCTVYNDSRWFEIWPKELGLHEPEALAAARKQYAAEIEEVKVLQFFFYRQWLKIRAYANERNIEIIGDIPIFVASDSTDAWANRHLFKFDEDGKQLASSGVPPDFFSETGQMWGNPVYDWPVHIEEEFAWWTERFRHTFLQCDIIRVDHFRGFAAYWEIPYGNLTAEIGSWERSPGVELFKTLKKNLGDDLKIIAEDLGVITPDVEELRDSNDFPGMKIFQFAFTVEKGVFDPTNEFLPYNCTENSVIYTGTHDNNTTLGWFKALSGEEQDVVRRYFEAPDDQIVWQMIRQMLHSVCHWAILPMQDWLELDESGRMNTPATVGGANWSWRLASLKLEPWRIERLASLIQLTGR